MRAAGVVGTEVGSRVVTDHTLQLCIRRKYRAFFKLLGGFGLKKCGL
jgi:hypothetical protein